MTIEVNVPTRDSRLKLLGYISEHGLESEKLDAVTVNVDVAEEGVDDVTDFLDANDLGWRLI